MLWPLSVAAVTLVSSIVGSVSASSCVVFDADFNLLLLGFGGKDFNLGQQSAWSSGSATDITASGRPPFDGTNTTCFLSQFQGAVYVLNGDKSNPTNVGIYDTTAKSWTTQATSTSGGGGQAFDPSSFVTILDHDTNVFYALSGGNLFFLDFKQMKAASSSAISWTSVGTPSFSTQGYNPVMALAQNHIHFLNVPNAQPGTAQIFVIHFSFFQPTAQAYPINGSSNNFPETHGQVASFFLPLPAVQEQFAFVPDDGSATYVIDVSSNSTAQLAGPSDKSSSTFTASESALVQLTSAGSLFFIPWNANDTSAASSAAWSKIGVSGLPAPSSTSSPSGSGGSSGAAPSGTGGSAPSGSSGAAVSLRGFEKDSTLFGIRIAGVVGLIGAAAGLLL